MTKKNIGMQITTGIALALILFGLFNLGVYTFYPDPDYSDFCDNYRIPRDIKNETEMIIDEIKYEECGQDYDDARDAYNNKIFYVFVIAGLILAVVGLFITYLPFQIVGIGTGTALIIEGIVRNIENKIPAFIAGVIVFGILAYFVWKKVKD